MKIRASIKFVKNVNWFEDRDKYSQYPAIFNPLTSSKKDANMYGVTMGQKQSMRRLKTQQLTNDIQKERLGGY